MKFGQSAGIDINISHAIEHVVIITQHSHYRQSHVVSWLSMLLVYDISIPTIMEAHLLHDSIHLRGPAVDVELPRLFLFWPLPST